MVKSGVDSAIRSEVISVNTYMCDGQFFIIPNVYGFMFWTGIAVLLHPE